MDTSKFNIRYTHCGQLLGYASKNSPFIVHPTTVKRKTATRPSPFANLKSDILKLTKKLNKMKNGISLVAPDELDTYMLKLKELKKTRDRARYRFYKEQYKFKKEHSW